MISYDSVYSQYQVCESHYKRLDTFVANHSKYTLMGDITIEEEDKDIIKKYVHEFRTEYTLLYDLISKYKGQKFSLYKDSIIGIENSLTVYNNRINQILALC